MGYRYRSRPNFLDRLIQDKKGSRCTLQRNGMGNCGMKCHWLGSNQCVKLGQPTVFKMLVTFPALMFLAEQPICVEPHLEASIYRQIKMRPIPTP